MKVWRYVCTPISNVFQKMPRGNGVNSPVVGWKILGGGNLTRNDFDHLNLLQR